MPMLCETYCIWRWAYFYFHSTIESMSHFDWLCTDSSNADGSRNFILTKRCLKGNLHLHPPIANEWEKKIKRYAISFACSILIELNWMLSYAFELCWTFLFVSFSPININWACDSNFLTNANFPFKFHRFAMLLTEICPQI